MADEWWKLGPLALAPSSDSRPKLSNNLRRRSCQDKGENPAHSGVPGAEEGEGQEGGKLQQQTFQTSYFMSGQKGQKEVKWPFIC